MHYEELAEQITNDKAHIVVMGLGYVGLPLAAELAKAGFRVTGYDPDAKKVESVNRGESYVEYPSSDTLQYLVSEKRLDATINPTFLEIADVIIICVPTPLNKTREPDLTYVNNAVDLVVDHAVTGTLVILESTTYPGTTREVVIPKFRRKFELGEDIFIAYSPERIDPGNPVYNLTNTPKVVAGATPKCSMLAQRLYLKINEQVVPVTSLETAEMVKILENTFRAVNIGLANEIALNCRKMGVDPFEVIDAASTKPYGFMAFYPGPGLGGHCIPVDPLYLTWKLRALEGQSRFIELADTINSGMPDHVISVVTEALNDRQKSVRGSSILVLGVAYKANVEDTRESPVIPIIQKLLRLGADVRYEDPHVPMIPAPFETDSGKQFLITTAPSNYGEFDLVLITTAHASFDLDRVRDESQLIVDTRGALRDRYNKPLKASKIYRI